VDVGERDGIILPQSKPNSRAILSDTPQGIRDLAMVSVIFLTRYQVSAVVGACVGHLEIDGFEHYLHVT
jgi:hypothetical protein